MADMGDINLFNVEMQVQRKKEEVYTHFLKDCVINGNIEGVKCSLEIIAIPYSLMTFEILENTSLNIIEKLIESKIKNDDFVGEIYSYCKLHDIESVNINDIDKIVTHFNLENEYDNCNRYTIINLFVNKNNYNCTKDDYWTHLHSDNLLRHYKNIVYLSNKILCDAAYYSNSSFLVNFISVVKKYKININFDPMSEPTHRQIFDWLCTNIEKARNGLTVGWRCGPDSGRWPSTDPVEYENVRSLLKEIYTPNKHLLIM